MRRKEFLQEFLGALGAIDIIWCCETDNGVSGTVLCDINNPEEKQDFVWYISESDVSW